MATKRSVSKRARFAVLARDGFRCRYCGACPPDTRLVVDHIIPIAEADGDNDAALNEPWNLAAACEDCNAGKAALRLVSGDRLLAEACWRLGQLIAHIDGTAKLTIDCADTLLDDRNAAARFLNVHAPRQIEEEIA